MCVNTRNWVDSAKNKDYCRAFVNAAFFRDVNILSTSPPVETLSGETEPEISVSLKILKPKKIGL